MGLGILEPLKVWPPPTPQPLGSNKILWLTGEINSIFKVKKKKWISHKNTCIPALLSLPPTLPNTISPDYNIDRRLDDNNFL